MVLFLIFSFKIITEQLLVVIEILFTSCQIEAKLLNGSKLKSLFAIQYCSHQHLNKTSENVPETWISSLVPITSYLLNSVQEQIVLLSALTTDSDQQMD